MVCFCAGDINGVRAVVCSRRAAEAGFAPVPGVGGDGAVLPRYIPSEREVHQVAVDRPPVGLF